MAYKLLLIISMLYKFTNRSSFLLFTCRYIPAWGGTFTGMHPFSL